MNKGKRYIDAAKQVNNTAYEVNEAISLACELAKAKFDETMELHVKLGVDPKQADQQVRGVVVLPNGTGREMKVLVLAKNMITKLKDIVGCDGYNVLQNNGIAAGQTVFHFHMHLIPRYKNANKNTDILVWNHETFTAEEFIEIKNALAE